MKILKYLVVAMGISMAPLAMSATFMPDGADYKDKGSISRCMAMHRYVASNHNSLFLEGHNEQTKFEREVFSEKELELIKSQTMEWYMDPEIVSTFNKMKRGDSAGWAISPAMYLAACITALGGK
ncbi:hypothetical protein [Pseudomonas phage Astolliot]|nr:hypothetical protein [Pseudomonas phage Astolliot]